MTYQGENEGQPAVRPEEALRHDVRDLHVEAGSEVELSPARSRYRDFFTSVEVRSIKDLQVLGLIPRNVPEPELRKAVASDDELASQIARETLAREAAERCGCHAVAATSGSQAYGTSLRRAFHRARRLHNPSLAKLLSRHQNVSWAWDSVAVASARTWVDRLDMNAVFSIQIAILQDIVIDKGATLILDPSTTVLLSRLILTHRTGRMVHSGPYLRIWASEIALMGPGAQASVSINRTVPWRLV